MRTQLASVGEPSDPRRTTRLDRGDRLRREQLRAETLSLRGRPPGKVGTRESDRETKVVLDPRALARLTARGLLLDQRSHQALGSPVHRGGQPGRASADDHQVVERQLSPMPDAGRGRELRCRRGLERLTPG